MKLNFHVARDTRTVSNDPPETTVLDLAVNACRESVTLSCPYYRPGGLQNCYYGEWKKKDSPTVVRIGFPSQRCATPGGLTVNHQAEKCKYELDRATFSLTINRLEVADSGEYECQLRVRDPAPGGTGLAFSLQSVNLTVTNTDSELT